MTTVGNICTEEEDEGGADQDVDQEDDRSGHPASTSPLCGTIYFSCLVLVQDLVISQKMSKFDTSLSSIRYALISNSDPKNLVTFAKVNTFQENNSVSCSCGCFLF